jgi:ATP-dependent DNA helicase DinG
MASGLPYIILNTLRNARQTICEFKQKKNAVLFATGSCWEGVDFPGDLVSSLIIVTLPFSVPDPIRDYERHSYPSLQDFIRSSVVPDMQKKLNQGFGRAIRTEQDTCVVSILDDRANKAGRYHSDVIMALPPCPITEQLADVRQFLMNVKSSEYWQNEKLPAGTRA